MEQFQPVVGEQIHVNGLVITITQCLATDEWVGEMTITDVPDQQPKIVRLYRIASSTYVVERVIQWIVAAPHPNIAICFGIIVMRDYAIVVIEHVEGETLQERIGHNPLATTEAMDIAQQIAAGLVVLHNPQTHIEGGAIIRQGNLNAENIVLAGTRWVLYPPKEEQEAGDIEAYGRILQKLFENESESDVQNILHICWEGKTAQEIQERLWAMSETRGIRQYIPEKIEWTQTDILLKWKNLQEIYDKIQQYDLELEIIKQMQGLHIYDAGILYGLQGQVLYALGRYEEALNVNECFRELKPQNNFGWVFRGILLNILKRYGEALDSCNTAMKNDENDPYAWAYYGVALGNLGRYEEALVAYDRSLQLNIQDVLTWINRGIMLNKLHKYEEALKSFDQALKLNPKHIMAMIKKGLILNKLERYEETLNIFNQVIYLDPKNSEAWYNKGVVLYSQKKYSEALETYEQALKLGVKDNRVWQFRGDALLQLQRNEEALNSFEEALKYNPKDRASWMGKGGALSNLGRHEEALHSYYEVIHLNPSDIEVWKQIGVLLLPARIKEAEASFKQALELDPYNQDIFDLYVGLLLLQKRYRETERVFQKYRVTQTGNDVFWKFLAQVAYIRGKYEKAWEAAELMVEKYPKDIESLALQGKVRIKQKRLAEALEIYDRVLQIEPEREAAMVSKAWILFQIGQKREANDLLQQTAEKYPESQAVWIAQSEFYLRQWRFREFIAASKRAFYCKYGKPQNKL